jgi:polysaccharide export outer membrane protein
MFKHRFYLVGFALLALFLGSCSNSYKKITYFKDVPDTTGIVSTAYEAPVSNYADITVQPDDILQVSVQTLDPQSSNMLGATNNVNYATQPASSLMATAESQNTNGFLVDRYGYIDMPLTGKLKVGGMTTEQVRDSIRNRAQVFYKTPVVNVRFANFKITVLGEVARPATYTVPNERIDLIEALGMAGDLTIYGKRENVLLIREENGKKVFVRFNLNSSDIYKSPYLHLKQRDVIYVEPSKAKAATTDASKVRTYSLLTAIASVLIIVLTRTKF